MVKELPLQNGMVALVDDEDFERCKEFTWTTYLVGPNKTNICVQTNVNNKSLQLTRFILNETNPNTVVTFKDGNSLNFQKSNLKPTTREKLVHTSRGRTGTTSKYKGVHLNKRNNKWIASIRVKGKLHNLGTFSNEEEAAIVYNKAAIKYFGEHAYQNVIGADNNGVRKDMPKALKQSRNSTSSFRGVCYNSTTPRLKNRWMAALKHLNKNNHLGYFETEIGAAKAYDKKALETFGNKAILNFPELKDEYLKELGVHQ